MPQTASGPAAKPILVGAHFDTSSAFNAGATDNGSGVALLLDLASFVSTLSSRTRPVYSVAFDREEEGLQGSTHFLATSTGQQPWHSVHMLDQIGGISSNVNIEAATSLTDCLWTMYGVTNIAGAFGIPLTRVTDITETDSQTFLNAGIRAINVSTSSTEGAEVDCIDNHPCDARCGGDCASGRSCLPTNCVAEPCICDSYQKINFEKLASVSLLVRKNLQRILSGADASCSN